MLNCNTKCMQFGITAQHFHSRFIVSSHISSPHNLELTLIVKAIYFVSLHPKDH